MLKTGVKQRSLVSALAVIAADAKAPFLDMAAAFALGRDAGTLQIDAECPDLLEKTAARAKAVASQLEVIAPTRTNQAPDADAFLDDLARKWIPKIVDLVNLGRAISVARFRIATAAPTISKDVLAVGVFAARTVVPVAVWKARFDRLRASVTVAEIDALTHSIAAYLEP
jgi:hypothetical protein